MVVIARLGRQPQIGNQIRFAEIEGEFKLVLETASGQPAGNVAEPFVRMQSSVFWKVHAPEGVEVGPVKRILLREDVWAELEAGTFELLATSEEARRRSLDELLTRWVPEERREAVRRLLGQMS